MEPDREEIGGVPTDGKGKGGGDGSRKGQAIKGGGEPVWPAENAKELKRSLPDLEWTILPRGRSAPKRGALARTCGDGGDDEAKEQVVGIAAKSGSGSKMGEAFNQ